MREMLVATSTRQVISSAFSVNVIASTVASCSSTVKSRAPFWNASRSITPRAPAGTPANSVRGWMNSHFRWGMASQSSGTSRNSPSTHVREV